MKKTLISSSLIVLMTLMVYGTQIWDYIKPNKTLNKEITLSIAPESNYTSAAYSNAKATVHVVVTKVRGNKETIVWDKVFDTIQLKNYPRLNQAYTEDVKIPGLIDNKEKLMVNYIITYDNNGSVLKLSSGENMTTGLAKEKMRIGI
ncbi:MAG: hypothetical protein ABI921_14280 [Panacibacter sp.]